MILDADSITGAGDPAMHTLTLPDGSTNGEHLTLIVNTTFGPSDDVMISPTGGGNVGGVVNLLGTMNGKSSAHYIWYSNAWYEV